MRRLGGVTPKAPRSISGRGRPYRYHLFFRPPEFPTKARATPWHKNLEFRGDCGIIVVPPTRHASGREYRWAMGFEHGVGDTGEPPIILQVDASRRPRSQGVCGRWGRGPEGGGGRSTRTA